LSQDLDKNLNRQINTAKLYAQKRTTSFFLALQGFLKITNLGFSFFDVDCF